MCPQVLCIRDRNRCLESPCRGAHGSAITARTAFFLQFLLTPLLISTTMNIILTESTYPSTQKPSTAFLLNQIWRLISNAVLNQSDPKIWLRHDRHGNTWWHCYDPRSGHTTRLSSEAEVRIWIEGLYYQRRPLQGYQ